MLPIPAVRGVNSTFSPAGRVPSAGGQSPQSDMRRGFERLNDRPQMNMDSGGGTNFNIRSPRVTTGGVIGPPPSGSRMGLGMGRL